MLLGLFKPYYQEYHEVQYWDGLILFIIFLNDLLAVLAKSQLHNFVDDNTIFAKANSTDDLLEILKEESEPAVK